MKPTVTSRPPEPVSRASSLGAPALTPMLHRESNDLPGGRPRRSGCDGCGNCCCGADASASAPPSPTPSSNSLTGWLADRPWIFVVGAFSLLIGVWATFITLAVQNPVRDVLKNPLPDPHHVSTRH